MKIINTITKHKIGGKYSFDITTIGSDISYISCGRIYNSANEIFHCKVCTKEDEGDGVSLMHHVITIECKYRRELNKLIDLELGDYQKVVLDNVTGKLYDIEDIYHTCEDCGTRYMYSFDSHKCDCRGNLQIYVQEKTK